METNNTVTKQTWIEALRLLSVFSVVMLHVSAGFFNFLEKTSFNWWMGNLLSSSTRFSVPVFIMISGSLLLDPGKDVGILPFYQKRLFRLMIPFVSWTVIYFLFTYIHSPDTELTRWYIGRSLITGRVHYHLWYIFMLPGLYLFTPFIRTYLRTASSAEVKWLIFLLKVPDPLPIFNPQMTPKRT